jgi:hypothetical protein
MCELIHFCNTLQEAFHKFIGQPVKIFCSSRTVRASYISLLASELRILGFVRAVIT